MRSRFIALLLVALAGLALGSVALAGGWAQVSIQGGPIDPIAGEEIPIDLEVLQHGATAVSWPSLTVIATDASSGVVVRSEAEPRGPEGSYLATIVFPTAGEWTLTFDSTDLEMDGSLAINVGPAAIAGQSSAAAAAVAPASDVLPFMVVLLLAGVALATAGLVVRSRAAGAGRRVSAKT